ncbi:MAG: thiol peroxidase [Bacteroidales bacterium]|jgi:thiol peroxidase|nr:thiol peroxidase [Mariniphaga sp.]NLB92095.1 thiol peroxidase [Bacteroidales bacterium]
MAQITLHGNPVKTVGELPKTGEKAKDFTLVKGDLSRVGLNDFKGKRLILNIFPSLDTGTCAASVRQFNKIAANLKDTTVLCISRDLPFAQERFCGAEGIKNVITLSDFVSGEFGKNYGLEMADGPLAGLHSRVVIILDKNGTVEYTQQVPEIIDEPNYDEVLKALKQ